MPGLGALGSNSGRWVGLVQVAMLIPAVLLWAVRS